LRRDPADPNRSCNWLNWGKTGSSDLTLGLPLSAATRHPETARALGWVRGARLRSAGRPRRNQRSPRRLLTQPSRILPLGFRSR